jgi:Ohr subfamily peroxiredoxin
MSKIEKVLATGKTHTTASRGGKLDIHLTAPGNPAVREHAFEAIDPHPTAEQLFAGAWSACYTAAVGLVASAKKIALPLDTAVEIEVDLGQTGAEYFLQARITLTTPGLEHELAAAIAHEADQICPYSKATRGNIDVALNVITD